MERKKVVPKRRFAGFTDLWEQRKLKDISKVHDGTHQTPKYTDYGIKFISVENINDIEASNKYISIEDYENQFKNKPEVGDIFMTRITAGVIGATAVKESDNPIAYYVSLALIKPSKEISSFFLSSYILTKEFKKELNKRIIHTAFPKKINLSDIGECSISKPEIEEQTKIGNFFKQLDDTIALHQRKLEKTQALKSAYLAEMFPAEDERMPKRRFAGFTGEWGKFILMDVVEMFDNLRVPVTASNRVIGSIPYYGANGIQDYVEGYTHEGEFVLIAEDGANDLNNYPVHCVQGKIWVNNHAHVLSGRKSIVDNKFLASSIKSINISKWLVGGGRAKLNAEVLKKIEIKIPIYEEQQKIGEFFKQLDDKITNTERKLEKLKAMKQAYLQEMFV